MASSEKEYDLVLLGASGYTGMLCAEHIALHLPTNLSWAIAGRSTSKLESLKSDLMKLNTDRVQPSEYSLTKHMARTSITTGACHNSNGR